MKEPINRARRANGSIFEVLARRRFPWPWRQEGRHFKLMLAVSIAVLLAVPILLMRNGILGAVALLLWLLTLAVQWVCIEPPDVTEKDLH